ncbi:MAG: hypothetical protein FJ147_11985 [Deltaproteobacteria bacterium]|nr:hypothetical protein [Deltaproteobacteria bacterium]
MSNQPVFMARDDRFHFAEMGGDWWATETAWFSFCHPERRLGGWFYTMARPNIGTVAGGAWIWDDSAHLPWEVLYSANYSALPLPRDQDLDNITLPTGVSIRVIEPCLSYELSYSDKDRLQAALRFDGVMAPEPLTSTGSTFGHASHFDQIGRVHGSLVLHGETIPIDCFAVRDRTWGRRPEDRPRQAAYVTGVAGAKHGFLAVTNGDTDRNPVAYGFLMREGHVIRLTEGERWVSRDPATHWITRIELAASDAEGRKIVAVGEPVNRIIINRHTFIDVNSLVRWSINGEVGWGEDQDMWPVHRWSRMRRGTRV